MQFQALFAEFFFFSAEMFFFSWLKEIFIRLFVAII
jgi:hypothetical protein